jgi:Uma2 family endonuclease
VTASPRGTKTLEDFLAIPEEERFHELLSGVLVPKAAPSGEHGDAQAGIVGILRMPFQRRSGAGGPGGWWIATEVEVALGGDVVRPDVLGWRRDRVPEPPRGTPVEIRPDWVCEVLSKGNARNDTVRKLRLYHHAGIPHYWLCDPERETLTVMRHGPDGYITVLATSRGETVRAEPFDAIELAVGVLFGDDPE